MAWAWDLKLHSTLKLVLLCLCDHADDKNRRCWPSVHRIAEKCSMERRHAQRCLAKLKWLGYITAIEGESGGRSRSTVYQINIEKGDTQDALSDSQERNAHVTPGATSTTERATFKTRKGDTQVARTIKNHHEPSKEPSAPPAAAGPPQGGATASSSFKNLKTQKKKPEDPEWAVKLFADEMGLNIRTLRGIRRTELRETLADVDRRRFMIQFVQYLEPYRENPLQDKVVLFWSAALTAAGQAKNHSQA